MRELDKELKELRLYGMAGAWEDLAKQGGQATLESSRWLLEHLLQAEVTDRAMRSVSYQMHAAKFPVHRDLAGFDFECSPVDKKLIEDEQVHMQQAGSDAPRLALGLLLLQRVDQIYCRVEPHP